MGAIGAGIVFPSLREIVDLNYLHIQRTGGRWVPPDNLVNGSSLEWVLDTIQYPLFGEDRYAAVADKAALLGWTIIAKHVFYDANKRTGMSSVLVFLAINGAPIRVTPREIMQTALAIADSAQGPYGPIELRNWIIEHTPPPHSAD